MNEVVDAHFILSTVTVHAIMIKSLTEQHKRYRNEAASPSEGRTHYLRVTLVLSGGIWKGSSPTNGIKNVKRSLRDECIPQSVNSFDRSVRTHPAQFWFVQKDGKRKYK